MFPLVQAKDQQRRQSAQGAMGHSTAESRSEIICSHRCLRKNSQIFAQKKVLNKYWFIFVDFASNIHGSGQARRRKKPKIKRV